MSTLWERLGKPLKEPTCRTPVVMQEGVTYCECVTCGFRPVKHFRITSVDAGWIEFSPKCMECEATPGPTVWERL